MATETTAATKHPSVNIRVRLMTIEGPQISVDKVLSFEYLMGHILCQHIEKDTSQPRCTKGFLVTNVIIPHDGIRCVRTTQLPLPFEFQNWDEQLVNMKKYNPLPQNPRSVMINMMPKVRFPKPSDDLSARLEIQNLTKDKYPSLKTDGNFIYIYHNNERSLFTDSNPNMMVRVLKKRLVFRLTCLMCYEPCGILPEIRGHIILLIAKLYHGEPSGYCQSVKLTCINSFK